MQDIVNLKGMKGIILHTFVHTKTVHKIKNGFVMIALKRLFINMNSRIRII